MISSLLKLWVYINVSSFYTYFLTIVFEVGLLENDDLYSKSKISLDLFGISSWSQSWTAIWPIWFIQSLSSECRSSESSIAPAPYEFWPHNPPRHPHPRPECCGSDGEPFSVRYGLQRLQSSFSHGRTPRGEVIRGRPIPSSSFWALR